MKASRLRCLLHYPKLKRTVVATGVAFALWFFMFSPWTSGSTPFWPTMAFSAVLLVLLSATGRRDWCTLFRSPLRQIALAIPLAVGLWFVFFVCDRIASTFFEFAPGQIESVYTLKQGASPWLVALLLLTVIGPAEEIFWRGYIQRNISEMGGRNVAFVATVVLYTLVHVFSFNLMLMAAAAVLGVVWGGVFWLRPNSLLLLIVSHALWDSAAFVFFPFR